MAGHRTALRLPERSLSLEASTGDHMNTISIIVPTRNSMQHSKLKDILDTYVGIPQVQTLVADGGSTDGTLELVKRSGITPVECPKVGTAEQINYASSQASGDIVLLHHARSLLPKEAIEWLMAKDRSVLWGGFRIGFGGRIKMMALNRFLGNYLFTPLTNIYQLDQCPFVRRDLFEELNGVPELELFEDWALCERLLLHGRPVTSPYTATTLPVRYEINGYTRQMLLSTGVKIGYRLGIEPPTLARWYERGLSLNR